MTKPPRFLGRGAGRLGSCHLQLPHFWVDEERNGRVVEGCSDPDQTPVKLEAHAGRPQRTTSTSGAFGYVLSCGI